MPSSGAGHQPGHECRTGQTQNQTQETRRQAVFGRRHIGRHVLIARNHGTHQFRVVTPHMPNDGDQVQVPARVQPGTPVATAAAKVNLNTAPLADLDKLPGIGAVRAKRIVDSREQEGPFAEPFELVERRIVTTAIYQRLRDLVAVRCSSARRSTSERFKASLRERSGTTSSNSTGWPFRIGFRAIPKAAPSRSQCG